jgi:hypothetical protein
VNGGGSACPTGSFSFSFPFDFAGGAEPLWPGPGRILM